MEGHQVTADVAPTCIYALLHLNDMPVVEFEVVFQNLKPFIFEVELYRPEIYLLEPWVNSMRLAWLPDMIN